MATSLLFIALLGILIGVFSNLIPFLGSTLLNFLAAIVINGYQIIAQNIPQFPLIPISIMVFIGAYFIGTFSIKILAILPIPIIQPIALMLRGTS